MAFVMDRERSGGREPVDVSALNRGWDVESRESDGTLRFIEVKGRHAGAETVCVTKNETLTCLNKRGNFYLAIVWVDGASVVDSWMGPDRLRCAWAFSLTRLKLELS